MYYKLGHYHSCRPAICLNFKCGDHCNIYAQTKYYKCVTEVVQKFSVDLRL